MRKIPEYLATSGKGTKNTQSKKGKMFGYQVLGFGAGGAKPPYEIQMMVVAGGGLAHSRAAEAARADTELQLNKIFLLEKL